MHAGPAKHLLIGAMIAVATFAGLWRVSSPGESNTGDAPGPSTYRLVYVTRSLQSDDHVDDIREIARRASASGLDGIVLSSSFDWIPLQRSPYFERLQSVKSICEANGLMLIPHVLLTGHASTLLENNRHLAGAVPVRGLPLVADGRRAVIAAAPVTIANGGFEGASNQALDGFALQDGPGEVTFVDRAVHHSGSASVRLSNFADVPHGLGRLMQEVHVAPYRSYRVRVWLKTERLDPVSGLKIHVATTSGRILMDWDPRVEATSDWREVVTGFNSLDADVVRIYVGVWRGRSGSVWIDDLGVETTGPVNVLRRPGTPLTIHGESSGRVYEEGRDFVVTGTDEPTYLFDGAESIVEFPAGSRIGAGERLRMDYYQALALARNQMAVCLSEPAVADLWNEEIRLVDRYLSPETYFIGCDEIRQGGWCVACEHGGRSAGELLGKAVRRQIDMIHAVNPRATIMIWSDMFDPNHNARSDYYLFKGDFAGSWEYLPRDVIVVCWNAATRRPTLEHFERLGLRTIAATYYDTGTADNTREWLDALADISGASGAMYTTWGSDYRLLESFGRMLATRDGDS